MSPASLQQRPHLRASLAVVAVCGFLGACGRELSAVNPAGPQAERISALIWVLTGLGSAVYLAVMGGLFYALRRGSQREESASGPAVERGMARSVGGAVGATVIILLGILIYNLGTGRALSAFGGGPELLTIRVVGHQWWWEVVYEDPAPHRRLTTANEILVPVGRRVRVVLESRDVIHSFWAPNLAGKTDLIPGYQSTMHFQADRAGVYHGRCAEFCGLQHARMDFRVIALQPDSFATWYERQLRPAAMPTDSIRQAGQEVFLASACVLCHTVRGTPAASRFGPDLTHLASRSTLAAGTIPNTRGHLAGWVVDPQRIKPGVQMPPTALEPGDLNALLAYLESLR